MRNHLLVAARESARPALDKMAAEERHEVAMAFVNAGMAVEFLLRAVVADLAPSLLFIPKNAYDRKFAPAMVRSHRDSMDDMSWVVEGKSSEFEMVRKVATEAVPILTARATEIDTLMNRRNAAVHMYAAEASALRVTMTTLVHIVAAVVTHLGADLERFWGDRLSLVNSLVEESENLMRVEVELQVRAAQQRVAHLRAGLAVDEAARVIATLESNGCTFVPPGPSEQFAAECPACSRQAEVFVRVADDLSYLDALQPVDYDDDGVPGAVLIPQEAVGVMLQCPVCLLRLSTPELQAAFPDIADLTQYELEARRGTTQEYDEILMLNEPDWETYPHGSQVG